MVHGTSLTPAHLSHPWAYQKSTSLHPPYPPDQQPACPSSTHARDFLPTKPKKQGPLMIYPTTLASKLTPRLRRHRHIITSHVNPTLMITLHRWWAFIDYQPPSTSFLWAFRFFRLHAHIIPYLYVNEDGWLYLPLFFELPPPSSISVIPHDLVTCSIVFACFMALWSWPSPPGLPERRRKWLPRSWRPRRWPGPWRIHMRFEYWRYAIYFKRGNRLTLMWS